MNREWFRGKKVTFLGDSITAGVATDRIYADMLCDDFGMFGNNIGISGTVLCRGGHRFSRLDDLNRVDTDSDLVIVMLGTNDWDQAVKNGCGAQSTQNGESYYSIGKKGTDDESTFRGAMKALVNTLKKSFGSNPLRIVFMTPPLNSWNCSNPAETSYSLTKKNIFGETPSDFADAVIDEAESLGYPALDLLRRSGIYYVSDTDNTTDEVYEDGLHPNRIGHRMMADALEQFLLAAEL